MFIKIRDNYNYCAGDIVDSVGHKGFGQEEIVDVNDVIKVYRYKGGEFPIIAVDYKRKIDTIITMYEAFPSQTLCDSAFTEIYFALNGDMTAAEQLETTRSWSDRVFKKNIEEE